MPNYKITDNITGKQMVVNLPKPPKDEDADQIFNTYYKGKEDITNLNPEPSTFERFKNSTADFVEGALEPSYSSTLGKLGHKIAPGLIPDVKAPSSIESHVANIPKDFGPFTPEESAAKYPSIKRVTNLISDIGSPIMGTIGAASIAEAPLKAGITRSLKPLQAAIPLATGIGIQQGIKGIGDVAGVSPEVTDLASQVGGLAAGGLAANRLKILNTPVPLEPTKPIEPEINVEPPNSQQPIRNLSRLLGPAYTDAELVQPRITSPVHEVPQLPAQGNTEIPNYKSTNNFRMPPVPPPEVPPLNFAPKDVEYPQVLDVSPYEETPVSLHEKGIITPSVPNVAGTPIIDNSPIVQPPPEIGGGETIQPPIRPIGGVTEQKPLIISKESPFKVPPKQLEAGNETQPEITNQLTEPSTTSNNVVKEEVPNAQKTVQEPKEEITTNKPETQITTETKGKSTENPYSDFSVETLNKLFESKISDRSKALIKQALEAKGIINEEKLSNNNSMQQEQQPKVSESAKEPPKETTSNIEEYDIPLDEKYQAYQSAVEKINLDDPDEVNQVVRQGLAQKLTPQEITEDITEYGGDEIKAKEAVRKAIIKYGGERGALGESEQNEEMRKWLEQFDETPDNETGPIGKVKNLFNKTFESTHNFLKDSKDPNAQTIGKTIPFTYDQERKWVGNIKNEFRQAIKGLSKEEQDQTFGILNGEKPTNTTPNAKVAAASIRESLDNAADFFEKRQKETGVGFHSTGRKMGRLKDYISHLRDNTPPDIMSGIKDWFDSLYREGTSKTEGSIYEDEIGKPRTTFTESRSAEEKYPISRDLDKVLGTYAEGMGRVAFRKPIVTMLDEKLNDIPEGDLKDTAKRYLKQFASFNEFRDPGMDVITRGLMNIDSRTRMLLNPRLWALHAARLGNIYQELPTKYMLHGAIEFAKNPAGLIQQARIDGLVPGAETGPRLSETVGQKISKLGGVYNIADAIPDAIAREGFKQKFIDEGYSPERANDLAITKAKDVSLRIDPVRQSELFSRYFQGPFKLAGQYKQTQFKILEQYLRNSANLLNKEIPLNDRVAMAGRMIGSTVAALGITKGLGITVWHMRGSAYNIFNSAGPVVDEFYKIGKLVAHERYEDAAKELAVYLTPGGMSVRSQIKKGQPSFFEDNPNITSLKDYFPSVAAP